jgi:glycosyltransferase involved in cell wall biosynthesis
MKIHFLLVKDLLKGGGVETYTRGVGRRLISRGHEVTVYSTGGDDNMPSTWEGMKVVWLPKVRPYWAEKFCGAAMAAYVEMRSDSPDVVHLHSVAAGAMAAFLRFRHAPCVVQMHGIEWMRSRWGGMAQGVLKTLERCSIASADAITAVSKTQCDYYTRRYGADCEYIPTAVDVKECASPRLILDLGLRPREYVLFAARIVPEKGLHYLIPAFRRLRTNYSLAIAGDGSGSLDYQQQLIELAGGDPRIQFLGDVRGRLLEELFSNAGVFAQPSELEGLSIGLIEAMSYGLQCVASDIPENREVIGEAGLHFRNKDTDDLRRVLDGAISNGAATAAGIGATARRRVEELFSWDLVVDQLESLYSRVISDRKRRSAPYGRESEFPDNIPGRALKEAKRLSTIA